jgi:hypothetical protein
MRRALPVPVVVVITLALLAPTGRSLSAAQDATPTPDDQHPVIGAWLLDSDVSREDDAPSLVEFSSDGTFHQESIDSPDGIGVWQPVDADTAALTITFVEGDGETYYGLNIVRATIDVAGDAFTADYTFEFVDPAGASSGEVGPGTANGTRMLVESMGSPVASFDEAFATPPEATPAP